MIYYELQIKPKMHNFNFISEDHFDLWPSYQLVNNKIAQKVIEVKQ